MVRKADASVLWIAPWIAGWIAASGPLRAEGTAPAPQAPAAAEAAAATLEQFAAHPIATLPSLSPDGTQMAIVFRTGDKRAVAVRGTAAEDDAPPRVLATVRSRPRWLRWSKQERVLVGIERYQTRRVLDASEGPPRPPIIRYNPFTRRTEYDIPPQPPRKELPAGRVTYVYAMRVDGHGDRHLGRKWPDPVWIQDDVLSWLPSDPRRVLISYDPIERFRASQNARPSVQAMSVISGSLRTVVREDRRIERWLADHDGEVRLGERSTDDGSILYRREGRKLVEVPTYAAPLEAAVRFAAYSYDPNVIYAWGPVQGRQALLQLRLSNGAVDGVFAHPEVDVAGPLVFDEAQRKLVAVGYVEDAPELHVLDETLAHERELIEHALPGLVVEYVSENLDRKLVLVRASSDVTPPRYYLFDRGAKSLRHELSEYPALERTPLAPMERVTIWARDGLALPAYLTRPVGKSGPAAAIVLVHDGPNQRAARRFDPLVQWLAHQGFVVLEPNYRGSSGYGAQLRSLGQGDWGGAMQDDLEDAAAWLVAEGLADPARIGIYGRGYGGYASLMALAREKTPFRAGASYGGPTDLVELLKDDERDRVETDWSRSLLGARKASKKELTARSPIAHVGALGHPVLLLHSERDERVRLAQAQDYEKQARTAGKAVELIVFDEELHELAQETNRVLWFQKLTSFFEKNLAAPAAPAPAAPKSVESAS